MILTCLKCGQAWHVSVKTKRKANNYICPKCEMRNKKSTAGTGIPNSAKDKHPKQVYGKKGEMSRLR